MKYYRLTAKLLAPLTVQSQRQSNAPGNLDYLPGSTLRGALAAYYLRQVGDAGDQDFQTYFLTQPISFPDLLPALSSSEVSQRLPLTVMSCKRRPGFQAEGKHGIRDTLVLKAVNKLLQKRLEEKYYTCPVCQSDLKGLDGVWNGNLSEPQRVDPSLFYQRHTGIDRLTGTVAQSIFYTTFAIADFFRPSLAQGFQQQNLTGGLFLTDAQATFLRTLINQGPIFAGADRTRGYGELEVELAQESKSDLDLLGWHQAFIKKFSQVSGDKAPGGFYFSMKLESPAILVDQLLRPTAEIKLDIPDTEWVLQIVKVKTIRGWNANWGLPKPDDLALAPGSVVLWRYTGQDLQGLKQRLEELTVNGVGLRKPEGLGRLSFCEPIHIQEVD